jgi:hypothetical protein
MSASPEPRPLTGILHLYVAFDWGDSVDLDRVRTLAPAEVYALPRRRRTPSSIAYRPSPLRFELMPVSLSLAELGDVQARAEATVFDFAGVSVALHLPFQVTPAALTRLSAGLADPRVVAAAAAETLTPLFKQLQSAIENPLWRTNLSEEYFVFHLAPDPATNPETLLGQHERWLAGLLRMEANPLSAEEIAEALRLRVQYSPEDLLLPDWGAAVLIDDDCEETLQTVEFTNLQLLEYRHIDNRLDDSVAEANRLMSLLARTWLPSLRTHANPMRRLGELRVEANELFERTGNVLKLVGDQYLARVYRQLATRFHLGEWEQSIQRKLDGLEDVYQILSDQAGTRRAEFLEVVIIVLILFEVVMAFVR